MENVFEGEVKELIYLGDHVRTRVDVSGNEDFIVKIPNSSGHKIMGKGRKITVGWSEEDCRALDAGD